VTGPLKCFYSCFKSNHSERTNVAIIEMLKREMAKNVNRTGAKLNATTMYYT